VIGFTMQPLAGWGNFPVEMVQAYRPRQPAEVVEILRSRESTTHVAAGLCRSYGDAPLNRDGGVVMLRGLRRFLDWDPVAGVVECEAGVSYSDLLQTFLPRGWAPVVTPGTKYVTVGGAIAADVHGKNHHHDGSFASCLESFRLLTATGEVLDCSPTQSADVFRATLGGMGLTGVILSARFRLRRVESSFIEVDYFKAANLDEALERFAEDDRYPFSVAWIDCLARGAKLGRSVLMRGGYAPAARLRGAERQRPLQVLRPRNWSIPFHFPGWVLGSCSVRLFNGLYYRRHSNETRVVDHDSFFYPLDRVLHWNRMYGSRGFVQYQMVFPPAAARQGLVEILEAVSAVGCASFLAVLKMFGPGNDCPLSFPMRGATLALDLPNGGPCLLALLDRLDRIVLRHGGRVYLAKDARMSREMFDATYPRAEELRAVKRRLDPEGRFSSSLARRLGLVDAATPSSAESK
jgi:FAD/FMN-containing dehydrogenase